MDSVKVSKVYCGRCHQRFQVNSLMQKPEHEDKLFCPKCGDALMDLAEEVVQQKRRGCIVSLSIKSHFDYAHKLEDHPGKCKYLHGHTSRVTVTLYAYIDRETGMVMDAKDMRDTLGEVLSKLDHRVLDFTPPGHGHPSYMHMPTIENIALYICDMFTDALRDKHNNVYNRAFQVVVSATEGESCLATASKMIDGGE